MVDGFGESFLKVELFICRVSPWKNWLKIFDHPMIITSNPESKLKGRKNMVEIKKQYEADLSYNVLAPHVSKTEGKTTK